MTAWDSEADAREFADAYEKRTAMRYPQGRPAGVIIELRGLRVLIVEGMPAALDRAALTQALWR
jgi:hypothetical protein